MEDVNKWKDVREPSDEEKRRIMGKVMKILTETLMVSHTYRFDGKVYRHEDGGPIGLEVTQVIARVVMLMWDKMAKKLFAELGMKIIMYCDCQARRNDPGGREASYLRGEDGGRQQDDEGPEDGEADQGDSEHDHAND
jgi:hypothetical protein